MNRLLKIHRIRLTTTLIVEALGGIALVVCWSLFPDFPYYFYIAFAFALFILYLQTDRYKTALCIYVTAGENTNAKAS